MMCGYRWLYKVDSLCFLTFLLALSCLDMDSIVNTVQNKAEELERMAEVLITGEQLR